MEYLYLVGAAVCSSSLSVLASFFNHKNKDRTSVSRLYSLLVSIGVFLSWGILYIFDFSFDPKVLLYSLIYGTCYALAMTGLINALKNGSTVLSEYVKSLSLVFVSIWGFIFWKVSLTVNVAIGLCLIAVALFFLLYKGKNKNDKSKAKPITLKWILFCLILLVGNAGCSIVQKYQQNAFNKAHGTQFMFFGTAIAVLVCFVLAIKEDKKDWLVTTKKTGFMPILAGVGSAVLNKLIMILYGTSISTSVIFPVIAVGGLSLTVTISIFIFKERLKPIQWIGLLIGIVAVALLNIK